MKRLLFIAMLSGCATAPQAPEVREVRVNVPVPVSCVTEDVLEPQFAPVKPTDSFFERERATLAELELRRGYEKALKAALDGCKP